MKVNFSVFIALHYISLLVGNWGRKLLLYLLQETLVIRDSHYTMLISGLNFQE